MYVKYSILGEYGSSTFGFDRQLYRSRGGAIHRCYAER